MCKKQDQPNLMTDIPKPETFIPEDKIIYTEHEILNSENRNMNYERSSYRQIFKATSLFGGVQSFNILIGIVRVKFVAVLLGTTGVGIMGLLNAPLQLIMSITGLGISFSAVRDISEANGTGDQTRISTTIITLRRWSWLTGLLGAVVTIIFAPFLSQWTFGNYKYTWAFIWLAVTLLLQAISKGQSAILQGTRRLEAMAKASVFASLIGLLTAVPLFYFFRLKGIVPSFIIVAITALSLSWYFARKVKIEPVKLTFRETIFHGRNMVKLGIVMTVTGMIGFLMSYILSAFISRTGGVEQVGLYNASWSIIGQSTGLVFTAMTTDYFPRLSAINNDDVKITVLVNQQAEMVMLILAPIIILLIGAMPIIIRILYTPAFLGVVIFANWMLLSIIIKGLVWPVGFIFPAKGDLKTFGIIEISAMVFNIITNILGYHLYGLEGLGISMVINYIFGLGLTYIFAHKKYGFKFDRSALKHFFVSFLCISAILSISYTFDKPYSYYYGAAVLIISLTYSFFELNRRLGIKAILNNVISRIIKRK